MKEIKFCHKLNFLIPIFVQPHVVNPQYFKLKIFNLKEIIVKYVS